MDYVVKTVYCKADMEGFYDAFLSANPKAARRKKRGKALVTFAASGFWLIAAVAFIIQLLRFEIYKMLAWTPLIVGFSLVGLWIYSGADRTTAAWRRNPNRKQEVVLTFTEEGFGLTQGEANTQGVYGDMVRMVEDKQRFYLFVSEQNAYMVPKRALGDTVDVFRRDVMEKTGLEMQTL